MLKNSDLEVGYVNDHEKQNIMLYYRFHKDFDEVHIDLEGDEECGFVLEERFDVKLRNVAAGKSIKIELKIFDYDEGMNTNSKMKLVSLRNELKNNMKDEYSEERIK